MWSVNCLSIKDWDLSQRSSYIITWASYTMGCKLLPEDTSSPGLPILWGTCFYQKIHHHLDFVYYGVHVSTRSTTCVTLCVHIYARGHLCHPGHRIVKVHALMFVGCQFGNLRWKSINAIVKSSSRRRRTQAAHISFGRTLPSGIILITLSLWLSRLVIFLWIVLWDRNRYLLESSNCPVVLVRVDMIYAHLYSSMTSPRHFFFRNRVSLCNSSGCSGTHLVDQAGLKLIGIHLPLPPEC